MLWSTQSNASECFAVSETNLEYADLQDISKSENIAPTVRQTILPIIQMDTTSPMCSTIRWTLIMRALFNSSQRVLPLRSCHEVFESPGDWSRTVEKREWDLRTTTGWSVCSYDKSGTAQPTTKEWTHDHRYSLL